MKKIKVLMLLSKGDSSKFIFNALESEFHIIGVFFDQPLDKKAVIKRRIQKLGIYKVLGQLLFQLYIMIVKRFSRTKLNNLIEYLSLINTKIPTKLIKHDGNLNSEFVSEKINKLAPDVILINGTRILSKKLLSSVKVPIINTHVGITPKYRGVHGGYWANTQGDFENCGVTIHLVDAGIDTGDILFQKKINLDKDDCFLTYPIKQVSTAIPLLKQAICNVKDGNITIQSNDLNSQLWHHPTLFEYIYYRITRGSK